MTRQFDPRRLDVKAFAEQGAQFSGEDVLRDHPRLLVETHGRGPEAPVTWSARGELRNPRHLNPQVWLHLHAGALMSLTCQRCLAPVDVPVSVDRSFRFAADESAAAAEDDQSEEDVLAMSRDFDLIELVEDELLMELPIAPRHGTCPPVKLMVADPGFEDAPSGRDNPFAALGKLRRGPPHGHS
jgi:uncharacterized protein